jgi:hypothetical protein
VSTPWIDVKMFWRITRSGKAEELGQAFIAAVDAAKAQWKAQNPELAELELSVNEASIKAIEIQDDYPWVKNPLDAPSAKEYRDNGLSHLADAPLDVQPMLNALLMHRYVYLLQSAYINNDPEVIRTQQACEAQREVEKKAVFVYHEACQVGVQIEVLSEGQTKRLLIGDIVPSGTSSGCCQDGIKDDDIVVRYRDLRPLFQEQDA